MVASTSATMVWKSKAWNDPLGSLLFPTNPVQNVSTRSENNGKAKLPVPGCSALAANCLARAWNEMPELKNTQNLGTANL